MAWKNVRHYLKTIGKKGGKARAKKLSTAKLSSQARTAITFRWMQKRFGVEHFAELALPGAEIVDVGLRHLNNRNLSSIEALAVAELRPKLRFLGVPVPDISQNMPQTRTLLYQAMEKQHGDMAYVRFCALLERIDSFCDALASIVPTPQPTTHRNRRWYT
ncbi:MAG: hypothetical protein COX62_02605 [Deltaproteobacteria bacterium CG_4_10_14_0_2_um_filter_43_8]|nr:MAG: hypothetical protein COV43_07095 [Deltaproteobacteria bacterium CG11_big_fil_rev_8_21_14_0_20_42_23]PJA21404.1 MAG: hypothetical protein COX62_02605 [Deltaproteobacteria bacterium CG_4_10_14_0_2_um_filter_43_8]PJC63869.1 MAG: hypothetical protein CO021_07280 [Deltaproteobacteria bacterium CG_4_9_14_0_2_um_filter_42_21]